MFLPIAIGNKEAVIVGNSFESIAKKGCGHTEVRFRQMFVLDRRIAVGCEISV